MDISGKWRQEWRLDWIWG